MQYQSQEQRQKLAQQGEVDPEEIKDWIKENTNKML